VVPSNAVMIAAMHIDKALDLLSGALEEVDDESGFGSDVYVIYNRLMSLKDDLEDLID